MSCTLSGCMQPSQAQYQNFCSLNHLRGYAWRQVMPEMISTPNGDRIFFHDRYHHEKNYEFSNFFPKSVVYAGVNYKTAEHAFQAQKFNYATQDPSLNLKIQSVYNQIIQAYTPKEASIIAKNNLGLIRNDWHQTQSSGFSKKEEIMLQVVKDKFTRHPNLRTKLLQTGTIRIVEDSPDDSFWGRGRDYKGENKLGRILMKIRSDMQNGLY